MKETQKIEFKEEFIAQKIKNELCGILNAQKQGESIEIHVGVCDNGKQKKEYKKLDESNSKDLVIKFLSKFKVEHSFVDLKNGGFIIKATANNMILSNGKNIYYRSGTTNEIVNEDKYKQILSKKKLNMLTITTNEFNVNDFKKLNNLIIEQKIPRTLEDFMFFTNMLIKKKKKICITSLGMMFKDNTSIPGEVFGRDISGNIIDLYMSLISEVNDYVKVTKTLQLDKMTRKTLEELYGDSIYEVTREIITNMLVHSSFKGIMPNPSFTVTESDEFIKFENAHVNENLAQQIKEKRVPHHAHNQKLFDVFRMLYLIEGEGIGFKTFQKNKEMLNITATNSNITLSIIRRK